MNPIAPSVRFGAVIYAPGEKTAEVISQNLAAQKEPAISLLLMRSDKTADQFVVSGPSDKAVANALLEAINADQQDNASNSLKALVNWLTQATGVNIKQEQVKYLGAMEADTGKQTFFEFLQA